MDPHDDPELDREPEFDRNGATTIDDHETHATTGGAAAAGAVTGGVIGLTAGPLGAALGAVGGAIVGVAAERMMHGDDDAESPVAEPTEGVEPNTPVDVTAATSTVAMEHGEVVRDRDEDSER